MKNILLIMFLTLLTSETFAGVKFRAREHFIDNNVIKFYDGSSTTYSGLSNTLNLWYEEPFVYSVGLAISPLLSNLKSQDDNKFFGDSIKLQSIGLEVKYYPIQNSKFFLRAAIYDVKIISTSPTVDYAGTIPAAGAGFEIPVGSIYIAPELLFRSGPLNSSSTLTSTVFSIGFHFYKF